MFRKSYTYAFVVLIFGLFLYRSFFVQTDAQPLTATVSTYMGSTKTVLLNPDGSIPWDEVSSTDICTADLFDLSYPINTYETEHFYWWFNEAGQFSLAVTEDYEFSNQDLFYTYLNMELPEIVGITFYVDDNLHVVYSRTTTYATVSLGCTLAVIK